MRVGMTIPAFEIGLIMANRIVKCAFLERANAHKNVPFAVRRIV